MILLNVICWISFIICYTVCNRLECRALYETSIFDIPNVEDICREYTHKSTKYKFLWYNFDPYGWAKTLMILSLLLTVTTFDNCIMLKTDYPKFSYGFIFIIYGGIWKFGHYTITKFLNKSKEQLYYDKKRKNKGQRSEDVILRNTIRVHWSSIGGNLPTNRI